MRSEGGRQKMISVIVPVYNVEKYIRKCIESVLNQTFQDFELILVDDGTKDKSGEICDAYAQKDPRIKVIHQENKGLSGARNTGLKKAEGEFLAFIDSDDFILNTYLQTLYECAVLYEADAAVCSYQYVWMKAEQKPGTGESCPYVSKTSKRKREMEKALQVYTGREAAEKIVRYNERRMTVAWGKLYRKNLKQMLFFPEGKTHEDEFVIYRALYRAQRVVVSDRRLYCYLQREESIMNSRFSRKRLDKLEALREAAAFFEDENDKALAAYAFKRYLLNIQISWYRVHKYMGEEKELLQKLRDQWKNVYAERKKEILSCSGFSDLALEAAFGISPLLYSFLAEGYVRLFPDMQD